MVRFGLLWDVYDRVEGGFTLPKALESSGVPVESDLSNYSGGVQGLATLGCDDDIRL